MASNGFFPIKKGRGERFLLLLVFKWLSSCSSNKQKALRVGSQTVLVSSSVVTFFELPEKPEHSAQAEALLLPISQQQAVRCCRAFRASQGPGPVSTASPRLACLLPAACPGRGSVREGPLIHTSLLLRDRQSLNADTGKGIPGKAEGSVVVQPCPRQFLATDWRAASRAPLWHWEALCSPVQLHLRHQVTCS